MEVNRDKNAGDPHPVPCAKLRESAAPGSLNSCTGPLRTGPMLAQVCWRETCFGCANWCAFYILDFRSTDLASASRISTTGSSPVGSTTRLRFCPAKATARCLAIARRATAGDLRGSHKRGPQICKRLRLRIARPAYYLKLPPLAAHPAKVCREKNLSAVRAELTACLFRGRRERHAQSGPAGPAARRH